MKKRFPPHVAMAIDECKALYIRAGAEHRFIFVWVVLVDDRVMIRSWSGSAKGWAGAFLKEKTGTIRLSKDSADISVRAARVAGKKLLDAMDVAYGEKYTTKANQKYVAGFATAKRRAMTIELLPNDH
jgi:hypothetical protein